MKLKTNYLLFIFLSVHFANAQVAATDSKGAVVQKQPSVMVIPRVNEGQDIRNILDQNEPLRAAVTKMKEWFDTRDFPTIDFVAKLKAALNNKVFTSENQTDMKTMILQMGEPDIYVELDVTQISCSGASIARVNMNAFYTATGYSIGSVVAESPCNTAEFGRLATKALDDKADGLLNTINKNFGELINNGVPIYIEFGFTQNSTLSMSSEIASKGNKELQEVIEEWMEGSAYKNQYSTPTVTDKRMMFGEVRIPLKNQANGKNYTSSKFAAEITTFLKSIGLTCKKDMKTGGIFINIQ
jgi:hypothetical protein